MKLYWVNGISYNEKSDTRPWLWFSSEACLSLKKAEELEKFARENFSLLDSWIDVMEDDMLVETIHKVYIDSFGGGKRLRNG